MSYKNDAVIMLLLFLNCLGKSDVLCLGGMMWKKAAVEISDALIHITSPVSVVALLKMIIDKITISCYQGTVPEFLGC